MTWFSELPKYLRGDAPLARGGSAPLLPVESKRRGRR